VLELSVLLDADCSQCEENVQIIINVILEFNKVRRNSILNHSMSDGMDIHRHSMTDLEYIVNTSLHLISVQVNHLVKNKDERWTPNHWQTLSWSDTVALQATHIHIL
jgi:hypothetical protein